MPLSVLPKISIITPSFNQGTYIEQCILSIMNQGYEDFEHIVVDGGSTDQTLSILEKYPHVIWISEPDNGQADALNKGFGMATGSVFGWLNSDDFYAPNIFGEVVTNLQDYPVVMGACELTDEHGTPKTKIKNKERGWFDLLKYWVPYSIPTQPSLFFRKEILQEVVRLDDTIFDPELNYCMDYDLWLRIAQLYPLSHRMDETLSYYRMTPDNKTSDEIPGMPYAEPEMSRIHRRYRELAFDTSYAVTIVAISDGTLETLQSQLKSFEEQTFKNFEVLVVINEKQKDIRKEIALYNERIRAAGFGSFARCVISTADTLGNTCNDAVNYSEGSLIVILPNGSPLNDSLFEIVSQFEKDSLGALNVAPLLAVRKVVLLETDGFSEEAASFDQLITQTIQRTSGCGWIARG